jgi:hypothetical protein
MSAEYLQQELDAENRFLEREIAEDEKLMEQTPLVCVCGDSEDMHIDGCEQCFVVGCGCREFEEKQV